MAAVASIKRQRNPRGNGAHLREEVLEAAMRILDRAPATELSLRLVASEVGVAAPSLYRRFPSAEDMIQEIVRECWRQISEAMTEASAALADAPPLTRLKAQMAAYARYALLRPSRYQLLYAPHINLEHEDVGPVRPASIAARGLIEEHLAAGGRIIGPDALSATILTISFVHGRVALAHLAPARPGNAIEAVEAFVCEALDHLFA